MSESVRDFYLGRQPVLDRSQSLFGYELLFRGRSEGPAAIENDLHATANVIAHAAQLGVEKVVGDGKGFVNVDAKVLESDIFAFLPRDKVVLEIVENTQATDALISRIRQLAGHGFKFALDDVVKDAENAARMLPLIDYIKMDLRDVPVTALLKLAPKFRQDGKKLVAEKVESREEFKTCLDLGFDYFQGYYFARPAIMSGKKLSPAQRSVIDLMSLISSDVDNVVIERAVKKDVTLALNLLRLVNTPAVGMRHKIDSLSQALLILGRRQLQRWLQIMLYAEPAKRGGGLTPLLALATTRGRLMELLANKLRPQQRMVADIAFTVGIMSLMDALFGMPMAEIVDEIPVTPEVGEALLQRTGFFGELLKLTECIENMDGMLDSVLPMLQAMAIDSEELVGLEMAAFEWSDNVVRYAI